MLPQLEGCIFTENSRARGRIGREASGTALQQGQMLGVRKRGQEWSLPISNGADTLKTRKNKKKTEAGPLT